MALAFCFASISFFTYTSEQQWQSLTSCTQKSLRSLLKQLSKARTPEENTAIKQELYTANKNCQTIVPTEKAKFTTSKMPCSSTEIPAHNEDPATPRY